MQPLLSPNSPVLDPESANCAMFYSITNCQEGLRGLPFGNFLIKKVAEDLSRELRQIRTFATVSPVPNFREWLTAAAAVREKQPPSKTLVDVVAKLGEPEWYKNREASETARRELEPACAYYLMSAKQGREPLDPVARFHLRNGASMERLNWMGDTSPAGLQRSTGLMVNYVYRLADVERNHELYMKGYQVTASRHIELLAKQSVFARENAALMPCALPGPCLRRRWSCIISTATRNWSKISLIIFGSFGRSTTITFLPCQPTGYSHFYLRRSLRWNRITSGSNTGSSVGKGGFGIRGAKQT